MWHRLGRVTGYCVEHPACSCTVFESIDLPTISMSHEIPPSIAPPRAMTLRFFRKAEQFGGAPERRTPPPFPRPSSRLEQLARQTALADDRQKRADTEFLVVRHGHGRRRVAAAPLHHDVAAALPNLNEPVLGKHAAQFPSGKGPQPRQPEPRWGSRTPRPEAAA